MPVVACTSRHVVTSIDAIEIVEGEEGALEPQLSPSQCRPVTNERVAQLDKGQCGLPVTSAHVTRREKVNYPEVTGIGRVSETLDSIEQRWDARRSVSEGGVPWGGTPTVGI